MMDEHECGGPVACDQRAAHRLAGAWWGGEHSVLVLRHGFYGTLLFGTQLAAEFPYDARCRRPGIVDGHCCSSIFDDALGVGEDAARQHEPVGVPLAGEEVVKYSLPRIPVMKRSVTASRRMAGAHHVHHQQPQAGADALG